MMKTNIPRLFAAILMMLGFMSIQAQSAVHPRAYYDAITYQWTDASGVIHENAITDTATDPNQIYALLKKVYCDPNIPGPKYSAYDQNGNREREVYYGAIGGGWDIGADDVTPPHEDGYTVLMVAVKEQLSLLSNDDYGSYEFPDAASLISYLGNNIAAVQLLTDGMRIGEEMRAGTVFNINGNYNRFFMLSKGQARQKSDWVTRQESYSNRIYGERAPFKQLFEQLAPTKGAAAVYIDCYAALMSGVAFPVVHDCSSVLQSEHYFSLAGNMSHESRSLTGLNIFIPDYRLLYWEDQFYSGTGLHTVDGRMLNPYYDLNGRVIRSSRSYFEVNYAQYNPDYAPQVGIYTIQLNGKAEPADEDKTCNVILDWTSSLDEMAHGTVPQEYTVYLVLTDEDGNTSREELITTTQTTCTCPVPQEEHSYTLSYIVYGHTCDDGGHDMFVTWSSQVDVVIPGWNGFLTLKLDHYESYYVQADELNYYRNFIKVGNEDAMNALTVERASAGENSFTLYRFDAAAPQAMTPVATLTLTVGSANVSYNIVYQNQEILSSYSPYVRTSGTLDIDADGAINLGPISLIDQFSASTALNQHPAHYGYVLKLNNTDADKGTNTIQVPVFKAYAKLDGYYTQEEVINDVEPSLTPGVKNANVEMRLQDNPRIFYYNLQRGDNQLPDVEIANLQHRTDGTFMERNDFLGLDGSIHEPGTLNCMDNRLSQGGCGDFMTYLPVAWTLGNNYNIDHYNSYGGQIMKTGVAGINAAVAGTRSKGKYSNWQDENGEWCSIYNPVITVEPILPTDASVEYEPCMVRVWRECDQVRNSTIDQATGSRVNDWWSPREGHKLIAQEMMDGTHITLGDLEDNTLAFGATISAAIKFTIRFYYKVMDYNGKAQDAPMYYVVEKVIPWDDIATGVVQLNVDSEGVNTYYNAQGLKSDKPFDGVNIVVTRYSDGSTKTTKVMH